MTHRWNHRFLFVKKAPIQRFSQATLGSLVKHPSYNSQLINSFLQKPYPCTDKPHNTYTPAALASGYPGPPAFPSAEPSSMAGPTNNINSQSGIPVQNRGKKDFVTPDICLKVWKTNALNMKILPKHNKNPYSIFIRNAIHEQWQWDAAGRSSRNASNKNRARIRRYSYFLEAAFSHPWLWNDMSVRRSVCFCSFVISSLQRKESLYFFQHFLARFSIF